MVSSPNITGPVIDDRMRKACRLLGHYTDEGAAKGKELYHVLVEGKTSVIGIDEEGGLALHDFVYSQHCYLVDTTPMCDRLYRPGIGIDFFYSKRLTDHIPSIPSPQVVLHSLVNNCYVVAMALDFVNGYRTSAFFKGSEPIPIDFISGLVRSLVKDGIDTIKMVVQPTPDAEQEYMAIDFKPVP